MPRTARTPGSPTLLLFPTDLERRAFERAGGLPPGLGLQAVCGFGPVVAAARTASLLERLTPRRVLLVGIAGAYDLGRDPLGSARAFSSTALDGVGAGEGPSRLGPRALGLPQWPGRRGVEAQGTGAPPPGVPDDAIEERLELALPEDLAPEVRRAMVLSVCAAAEGAAMASERRRRFPDADAEDMEAFAVAAACALGATPCAVVRGISNAVGDRDPKGWRIGPAMAAARTLAAEVLGRDGWIQGTGDR